MRFKLKFNIKRELIVAGIMLLLFFFIAFSERKHDEISIHDIRIKMENIEGNHFLEEKDVVELMKLDKENLKGARISKVNLKEIEKRIMNDRFIKNAELYSDLKGNMIARVELQRPIARIVRNDGPDGYIAEDGTLMPTSDKYTARVVLLSGSYMKKLLKQESLYETEEGNQLMALINLIRGNDFWRAQIAQLDMDGNSRILIYPQIGGQIIEFGKLEKIEVKMNKLRIFYKDILPQMGWNKYKRVSLEYEGQIVAE